MGAVLRQGAVEQEVRHYFSDGRLAIQPEQRAMCAAVSTYEDQGTMEPGLVTALYFRLAVWTYEDRQSEIQTRGPWNQCAGY